MMQRVAALALLAAAAVASVHAMEWDTATTSAPGNLWYPGVAVTYRFWSASDMRFDSQGVNDQASFTVQFQTGGSYVSPLIYPGETTDYCNGCVLAPPKANTVQLFDANGNAIAGATKTFTVPAYSYATLVISGTRVNGYTLVVNVETAPRYYQASYWLGLSPGAYHVDSLWTMPQAGDRQATLTTDPPHPSGHSVRSYMKYKTLSLNVSVGDSQDGDLADPVYWTGAQIANTPYFTTAAFVYASSIPNNQGLLSGGSIIQLTGAALDTTTSYVCVFNNTDQNVLAMSPPTNPTSTTQISCTFPDAIAQVSQNGDDVQLINVTVVSTTDPLNPGWLPISSRAGNEINFHYVYPLPPVPPGPDSGSPGLSGGQIFGIILAVFVGVGVLGYGGFRLYKHYNAGGFGYETQSDRGVDNKPNQIQYNPSSYQSNDDATKPFQASGDNI